MEDSVAAKSKLPTKMFFISSSVFQSCALDSADLDLGQVVAGLSKGSFSIAGHCQRDRRHHALQYRRSLPSVRPPFSARTKNTAVTGSSTRCAVVTVCPPCSDWVDSAGRRLPVCGFQSASFFAPHAGQQEQSCRSHLHFTATSQIFSRLDLPSGPSTSRVTV